MTAPRSGPARRTLSVLVAGALGMMMVAAACGSTATPSAGGGTAPTVTNAPATTVPGPAVTGADPAATLTSAVTAAFDQERAAAATYANVIARLGDVGPFPNIAAAEDEHVAAVRQLAANRRITLPSGASTGQTSPATVADACRLGISVEQATVALYDRLLAQVAAYPDATQIFTNLRTAAAGSHLPAFQRCA